MTILSIIESIAATASRLEKEAILTKHKGNVVFKEVLRLAYNPFINFWIRKIPEYSLHDAVYTLDEAIEALRVISERRKTGNDAIKHLATLLSSMYAEDANVLERIVLKDLRCGISASTINKVFPLLVPTYPVMLCEQFEQKYLDRFTWPAYVQLKADGMRFNAIVKGGSVTYFSRNGKPLDLKGQLDAYFLAMAGDDALMFDGELLVLGDNNLPLPRKTGNGILAKAIKNSISDAEAARIAATLWDVVTFAGFERGLEERPYHNRFQDLIARWSASNFPRIEIVDSMLVSTMEQAQVCYKDFVEQGFEGAVLKDPSGFWEDKRSKKLLKMKGEEECDLICVGFNKHEKRADMVGSLVLESQDGKIKVSCGSGLNDRLRLDFFKEPPINRIIAVKYNARIHDIKSGQESLFLPIFLELRTDKDTADTADRIK